MTKRPRIEDLEKLIGDPEVEITIKPDGTIEAVKNAARTGKPQIVTFRQNIPSNY